MIVALPCIAFSVKEREIIVKYGFLTWPAFIDNFYVRHRKRRFRYFQKLLKRYKDKIQFAVAPDYDYELMERLKRLYPHITWIFPLHKKEELEIAKKLGFEWIGMPHREHFRDYSISWFVKNTYGFKRWYLGFWLESRPEVLLNFDGFDTTIPETYSGKYGKIWLDWGKSVKAENMKTIDIFETNVKNFRKAVNKIERQKYWDVHWWELIPQLK